MNRHPWLGLAAVLTLMAMAVSCSKKASPTAPTDTPTQPSVYISGCFTDGTPTPVSGRMGA